MLLAEELYTWLVHLGIIPNKGQVDEKHNVAIPSQQSIAIDNGYLVGQVIKKLMINSGKKIPISLNNVKPDNNKNTKLTNWNFIWLTFEGIGLKLDNRIKELILQGEQALVIEVLRQLKEKDPSPRQHMQLTIKPRPSNRAKNTSQAVDIKKINLNKDPEDSETSLQFLILLLKSSLAMNLQEILGLFTNQNKYLAHIIVKGLNENFQPLILLYTLLNKHAKKLKEFHENDPRDAEACLFAIKPGFISKNEQVAELTLQLFSKLGTLYYWFINQETKASGTYLLGFKRHPSLRQKYWTLLMQILGGQERQYFTEYYSKSYQTEAQQVQITTYLIKFIVDSPISEKLVQLGLFNKWFQKTTKLSMSIENQIIAFNFIGQMMLFMPNIIEQNEQCLLVIDRHWNQRNLCQFSILFNELVTLLEKLAEGKSPLARKIYTSISNIASTVGPGDKRDIIVEYFVPLLRKFPTIPSQQLIQQLKHSPLSYSQYLLVCEAIQISQDSNTLIDIGMILKHLFTQDPLINFYAINLIKEIVTKVTREGQQGLDYVSHVLEDTLSVYNQTEIKYKTKPKNKTPLYFGRSGNSQKLSKQDQVDSQVKEKWKELFICLVKQITDIAFSEENNELKEVIKEKLSRKNAQLKSNNFKVGSKVIEDMLASKFGVSKEEQAELSEQYKQQRIEAHLENEIIRKSKVTAQSHVSLSTKLKGPENLVREFQDIIERRKLGEEEHRAYEIKKQLIEQKKKINVKKELQITNLLRGTIGQAQIRQEGFLERLIQEPKQTGLISLEELEARDIDAIEVLLKKYHRALRHVFFLYTGTMYSNHTAEAIEDNQRRKEILTAVELGKLLKNYRFMYLTSQPEIGNLVRDINVKLLHRRQVNQLDFKGFQQFIIQFCFLKMTIPHEASVTTPNGIQTVIKNLKNQPIQVLLKQFFNELKESFIVRQQKLTVFEDVEDVPLTKQQQYEVNIFRQKQKNNPQYILPKGYKKIVQKSIEFPFKVSPDVIGLPLKYEIAYDALDYIFSKSNLNMHIMENLAQKHVNYKVRPTIGIPEEIRERASSTVISRKSQLVDLTQMRSSSKHVLGGAHSTQIALEDEAQKQKAKSKEKAKQRELQKQKRSISMAKLAQLQKVRDEAQARKAKEKEEQRERLLKKEKEIENRRRIQTQQFLKEQKVKYQQKRKQAEQSRLKQIKQQQQQERQKKENKQKFKELQKNQIQRIRKIEQQSAQRNKKNKEEELQHKQRLQQQKRRLREKIEQDDRKIVQRKREIERKLLNLFQSDPIKNTFQRYQPNLKSIYEFLIQRTHLSLTQKKHNNQIIFDTWRYFLNAFEISPLIVHPKDVTFIFKSLAKDKFVPKQHIVGLSFKEYQQALLRIVVKYKSIFNVIAQRIKDKVQAEKTVEPEQIDPKNKKGGKKGQKITPPPKVKPVQAKEQNQFETPQGGEINIKQLLQEDKEGKDEIDQYGDVSKVTDKTLRGLIYYLKVPSHKQGQDQRFRTILGQKQSHNVQNVNRLKQKLNEEYTLEPPPKKPQQPKIPLSNRIAQLGFNPTLPNGT